PLPPAASHQRIVKSKAQTRTGVEPSRDTRVALELRAVTFDLGIHEPRDVGAFVASGLEIDNPADAVRDKSTVERDVDKRAVIVARERELALRLFMRRLEQPASARIVCDASHDFASRTDRARR